MKKNRDKNLWCALAFLICFIPRFVICFINPTEMRLIPDEIGQLAATAKFAGLEWTPVVSTTGYYGIGYHMLFAPLFAIIEDFVVFHFILRVVAAILCSLVAIIAYKIAIKFGGITDYKYACVASIICSYCMAIGIRNVSNEYALNLISWLIAYYILELSSNCIKGKKKLKVINTIILIVLLVYSLSIHTRSIVLWGAVVAIVVLYYLFYKESLVSIPTFVIGVSGGYLLYKKIEPIIQANIWAVEEGTAIRNSSSNLSDMIGDGISGIFQLDNILAMFKILFGNIYTLFYFTGGLATIALIILFMSMKRHVKNREFFLVEENRAIDMIFWFFAMCIVVIIGGLVITWYPNISKGMQGYDLDRYSYYYKGIVYSRYYASYAGPLLLACMVYLKKERAIFERYFDFIIGMIFVLSVVWIKYIVVHLVNYGPTVREFVALTFKEYNSKELTYKEFLPALIFLMVMVFLLSYCIKHKNVIVYLIIVSVFMIYSKFYYDLEITTSKYSMANASKDFIYELEEKGIDVGCVYVPSISRAYAVQALLSRYTVIPEYPEADIETAIVISGSDNSKELIELGYESIVLESDECVWIKGITLP